MSYILEALKKLEQKRQHDERGRVAITFQGHTHKEPEKRWLWIAILSVILFISAACGAWWVGPWRQNTAGVKGKPSAGDDLKRAASEAVLPAKSPESAATGNTTLFPEARTAKVSPGEPLPKEIQGAATPPKPASPPGTVMEPKQAVEATRIPKTRQAAAAPEPTFTDTFPRAEPKPPPGGKVLKFADLPASVASVLPEFKMSLHYYISEPRSRFARINDRTLREGQSLSEGLKLDEITQAGAVMNYKGWRFLIPISVP